VSEKTEQPTAKKIRDARKKGEVAFSKEVNAAVLIVAVFAWFAGMGDFYSQHMGRMLLLPIEFINMPFDLAWPRVAKAVAREALLMTLPLLGLAAVLGVLAGFLQVGPLFTLAPLKPELKKLNPASGIKKIFSLKNVLEFLKSVLKIVFLGVLLWVLIRGSLDAILKLPRCGLSCLPGLIGALMMRVALYSGAAFIVIAAADYAFQKRQYIKKLMMTKEEVKREYKESEGDPMIKSKRRQLHRELMTHNMLQNVRRASVVVTNPTHIAVALIYEEGETPLPLIAAKGENLLARRIIEIAREEGIPVLENVPLARALHRQGEIDRYIPPDLLEPVAEVLRWVQSLQAR